MVRNYDFVAYGNQTNYCIKTLTWPEKHSFQIWMKINENEIQGNWPHGAFGVWASICSELISSDPLNLSNLQQFRQSADINMQFYAQFSILRRSTKFELNFLEDREINCCKCFFRCKWSTWLQMVQLQVSYFAANGRYKWSILPQIVAANSCCKCFCGKCPIFPANILFCC